MLCDAGVMYTHSVIDDALYMAVGFVPEVRVLWNADVTDLEYENDCIGCVWYFCWKKQILFWLLQI